VVRAALGQTEVLAATVAQPMPLLEVWAVLSATVAQLMVVLVVLEVLHFRLQIMVLL